MPHFPRLFSVAFLILILPTLTGCVGWQTVDQPIPEAVSAHRGEEIRIQFFDATTLEADSAVADPDTLIAWRDELATRHPFTTIRKIYARAPKGDPLLVGAVVVGAVAFIVFLGVLSNQWECFISGGGGDRCS